MSHISWNTPESVWEEQHTDTGRKGVVIYTAMNLKGNHNENAKYIYLSIYLLLKLWKIEGEAQNRFLLQTRMKLPSQKTWTLPHSSHGGTSQIWPVHWNHLTLTSQIWPVHWNHLTLRDNSTHQRCHLWFGFGFVKGSWYLSSRANQITSLPSMLLKHVCWLAGLVYGSLSSHCVRFQFTEPERRTNTKGFFLRKNTEDHLAEFDKKVYGITIADCTFKKTTNKLSCAREA